MLHSWLKQLLLFPWRVALLHFSIHGPSASAILHLDVLSWAHYPSTCPANGLPTLSRASWSNRTTTAQLLSNAFSHTPSQWSLPTAFCIGALDKSWCLPRLGRETGTSLRTRLKPAECVWLMDASLEHMESSNMIVRRSPMTLKKQCPWGWKKQWIIHYAPNYCSSLFSVFMNECVSLLGCCNVLELCTSVQMEKMFQLEAVKPAGVCPL